MASLIGLDGFLSLMVAKVQR